MGSAYHVDVLLDANVCYRAMLTHDARFDGCFFGAVTSTGIYCRPICRVKPPKRENCVFLATAAACEAAGYRPCLRCRPELAPGNAGMDAIPRLARSAAALIEEGALQELGLEAIANRLGVTARHLRRVFLSEFGVTPIAFAQTQRLLMAKRLLTDTALSVTEVAFTSGFKSLRRMNALFRDRYHLSPARLRRTPRLESPDESLHFQLSYRPPYDWTSLLTFLGARAISGVEGIGDGCYRRTALISHGGQRYAGWLEISHDAVRRTMRVTVSTSLSRATPAVLARIKHLFDLSCDPAAVGEALGCVGAARPGLRVPGAFDGFEIAVRAILGQQVSVAAARTLAGRFAAAFGAPIETPFAELTTTFPQAGEVAHRDAAELTHLGILPSRARTILGLAQAIVEGTISLRPGVEIDETIDKLQAIPGIGPWTAQYIAMRALAWPDAFPHQDLGVMKTLRENNPRRVLAAGEAWRPWRSYAVMHLWAGGAN